MRKTCLIIIFLLLLHGAALGEGGVQQSEAKVTENAKTDHYRLEAITVTANKKVEDLQEEVCHVHKGGLPWAIIWTDGSQNETLSVEIANKILQLH